MRLEKNRQKNKFIYLVDRKDEKVNMKISELFEEIKSWGEMTAERTCDTYKAGDGTKEITGVAVSMFATPEIIRECERINANLLIVHEPVFYNHWDEEHGSKIAQMKKELIEKSGITIVRYHDYAHTIGKDMIYEGELKYLGLKGKKTNNHIFGVNGFILDEELTAKELAKTIENELGIRHVRIAGCSDKKGRKIACCFGTPGHVAEMMEENDFVLTGEIVEWEIGEMARDYMQLGYNKAVLVMGHIGSERAGMMYFADLLKEKYNEFKTDYLECGEVYSYTD